MSPLSQHCSTDIIVIRLTLNETPIRSSGTTDIKILNLKSKYKTIMSSMFQLLQFKIKHLIRKLVLQIKHNVLYKHVPDAKVVMTTVE